MADLLRAGEELVPLYQTSYALFTRDLHAKLLATPADQRSPFGLPAARAAELARRVAGQPELHAIALLEFESFLGQRLLRDSDCASMAVSLEVRVPLVDHALVEAAAGLTNEERFLPLGRKQLLRSLAPANLDPAVFERPKAGFVLPIEAWCRSVLRDEVSGVLHDRAACARVGLEARTVERLWRAFEQRAPGLYWSRIWSLYVLLRWSAQHGLAVGS